MPYIHTAARPQQGAADGFYALNTTVSFPKVPTDRQIADGTRRSTHRSFRPRVTVEASVLVRDLADQAGLDQAR